MKLRFPGTGFGLCKIKKSTSKEYRRPTSLLVDDALMIDPTEWIFEFEEVFGLDKLYRTVQAVLVTHYERESTLKESIMRLCADHPISVYATEGVIRALGEIENVSYTPISPYCLYEAAGYQLMPLRAASEPCAQDEPTLSFALCRDRAIYYGIPGGAVTYECFAYLKELKLDAMVLDCALLDTPVSGAVYEHLSVNEAQRLIDILTSTGTLSERARVLLANLPTDRKRKIHEEMTERVRGTRMTTLYDGFFLTI